MVKKTTIENWKTKTQLTTPSQINKFFDSCTEWVLQKNVNKEETCIDSVFTDTKVEHNKSLGLTDEDFVFDNERKCFFCGGNNTQFIIANPFCIAYAMSACSECLSHGSS